MSRAFAFLFAILFTIAMFSMLLRKRPLPGVRVMEVEQQLAYFREDIAVNKHHENWHALYPFMSDGLVKDREGELFYFMHLQLLTRYNIERMALGLARARSLSNLREPIAEPYYPIVYMKNTSKMYAPREPNALLSDIRLNNGEEVAHVYLEIWLVFLLEAIDKGYAIDNQGMPLLLDNEAGIDYLGNMIESNWMNTNQNLYGSLHNLGHTLIAFASHPVESVIIPTMLKNPKLLSHGVMLESSNAMRDPVFYRWHTFIQQLFERHKARLPPYRVDQHLAFDGISVLLVQLQIDGDAPAPVNTLQTFWQRRTVQMSAELLYGHSDLVHVQIKHLQHEPFSYHIEVENAGKAIRRGTCRIFLAPTVDEVGVALPFNIQRTMMLVMDRFPVDLVPGRNWIRRRSDQSTITSPHDSAFRPFDNSWSDYERTDFHTCGCGWPQHMLLPRSNARGLRYEVFVMISNFKDDTINEEQFEYVDCKFATTFCGLTDQSYPDRRPMGFPFDRRPLDDVDSLTKFASLSTNMAVVTCVIRFNETEPDLVVEPLDVEPELDNK